MADQKELQRKNQELIRQNRRLEQELQKKVKAYGPLGYAEWAVGLGNSSTLVTKYSTASDRRNERLRV